MKFGPFEGVMQRAYLRLYDIFSPKKHLTIRAFHPIIYIISVVLSADSKERRRQDEKANRKHPACPVYAAAGENIVDVPGGVIIGGTSYPIQLYSNYVYDGGGVYIAPGGQLTMTGKSIFSG